MEFVKDNGRYAIQRGILDEHPGKDAFRNDLDAGVPRHFRVLLHAIADAPPHGLSHEPGHALGNLARSYAAGLQHEEFAVAGEAFQDGQRQDGGLTGTRRCRNNKPVPFRKRTVHLSGNLVGRERSDFFDVCRFHSAKIHFKLL